MTHTETEKKKIEIIMIALLLIAMLTLVFISISINNKYNGLVLDHNELIEEKNYWAKLCPQINNEVENNEKENIFVSDFKLRS